MAHIMARSSAVCGRELGCSTSDRAVQRVSLRRRQQHTCSSSSSSSSSSTRLQAPPLAGTAAAAAMRGAGLVMQRRNAGRAASLRAAAAASANSTGAATGKGPIVVVDNYDSFTYNLCQYLGDLGADFVVLKNDEKTVEEIRAMNPAGVLVSPGPDRPEDSGISLQVVLELGPDFPVFGVCMGHQCIGQSFGGDVIRAPCGVMHGKTSDVFHNGEGLFEGLANPFKAARYHSLVIDRETCPEDLEVTAWTEDGTIMGVRHRRYPLVQGVQFHPESIITDNGKTIVANFVKSL